MIKSQQIRENVSVQKENERKDALIFLPLFLMAIFLLLPLAKIFNLNDNPSPRDMILFFIIDITVFLPTLIFLRMQFLKSKSMMIISPLCTEKIPVTFQMLLIYSHKCPYCFKIIVDDDINS